LIWRYTIIQSGQNNFSTATIWYIKPSCNRQNNLVMGCQTWNCQIQAVSL